jgi:hypothetical protein
LPYGSVYLATANSGLKPYENKWVAVSPDYVTVVASGGTLKEAHAHVPRGEREMVVFHKVLPFDALYIPTLF